MHLRLFLVDVEGGAGDQPLLQRPRERGFVDNGPARRVDQICGALHLRQRLLVDQMVRLRRQRAVQRHDVGGGQQPIERHRRRARAGRAATGACTPPTCRRPAPSRDGPRDAADADDAELLAAQLHPEHVVERPALPTAPRRTHALAFAEPPRDGEDQRPGEVGARVGQHVRRVGDLDARARARRHVDVVVADGDIGDDLAAAAPQRRAVRASMRSVSRQMSASLPAIRCSNSSRGIASRPV